MFKRGKSQRVASQDASQDGENQEKFNIKPSIGTSATTTGAARRVSPDTSRSPQRGARLNISDSHINFANMLSRRIEKYAKEQGPDGEDDKDKGSSRSREKSAEKRILEKYAEKYGPMEPSVADDEASKPSSVSPPKPPSQMRPTPRRNPLRRYSPEYRREALDSKEVLEDNKSSPWQEMKPSRRNSAGPCRSSSKSPSPDVPQQSPSDNAMADHLKAAASSSCRPTSGTSMSLRFHGQSVPPFEERRRAAATAFAALSLRPGVRAHKLLPLGESCAGALNVIDHKRRSFD